MQTDILEALRVGRPQIHDRWEALLRVEPARTPLGHPDALVHLIDWTLAEVIHTLQLISARRRMARCVGAPAECPCGLNPLLGFFSAGQQALREALVLAQSSVPGLGAQGRDAALEELDSVLHEISKGEIDSFCAVCQYRAEACDALAGRERLTSAA